MIALRVFRWSEGGDERFDTFDIAAGPETTVLDALVEAQRAQDSTLAFRYACRVGMCGSCAMVVDGRERWACRTRLAALAVFGYVKGRFTGVEPLRSAAQTVLVGGLAATVAFLLAQALS